MRQEYTLDSGDRSRGNTKKFTDRRFTADGSVLLHHHGNLPDRCVINKLFSANRNHRYADRRTADSLAVIHVEKFRNLTSTRSPTRVKLGLGGSRINLLTGDDASGLPALYGLLNKLRSTHDIIELRRGSWCHLGRRILGTASDQDRRNSSRRSGRRTEVRWCWRTDWRQG